MGETLTNPWRGLYLLTQHAQEIAWKCNDKGPDYNPNQENGVTHFADKVIRIIVVSLE